MSESTHDLIIKPLTVGAVGGVASLALVPMDLKFAGLPAPIGLGLVMSASSFVNAVVNETVYESLLSDNESELVYNSTAPVITGLATSAVAWGMLGDKASGYVLMEFFALGAVAEVGGDWIDSSLLGPALDL